MLSHDGIQDFGEEHVENNLDFMHMCRSLLFRDFAFLLVLKHLISRNTQFTGQQQYSLADTHGSFAI
ncbi:hypothetical protein IU46_018540 [Pantoea agglomerans]|nr:hypothetical protein IU46_018540 [Pantoea agglomerans]